MVSTTNYAGTDGETERKNREITEIFAGYELEHTDGLTAASEVHIQVNSQVCRTRGQGLFFTIYGFQHRVSSTQLQ